MVRSVSSYYGTISTSSNDDDEEAPGATGIDVESAHSRVSRTAPSTPTASRRLKSTRTSELDLHSRLPHRTTEPSESSSLLESFQSARSMPRPRHHTRTASARQTRELRRSTSVVRKLASAFAADPSSQTPLAESQETNPPLDDRGWYDQFTSTDWVHDSIADAFRMKELRARRDFRGRLYALLDGAQGWILVALIGCMTACLASVVNVTEVVLFDWKSGHCAGAGSWWKSRKRCCDGGSVCDAWVPWSATVKHARMNDTAVEYAIFIAFVITLSLASCCITLMTRTVINSTVSLSTLDENLGAEVRRKGRDADDTETIAKVNSQTPPAVTRPPMVYYSAAGSGVAEVRVILSGFVLHGYLGVKTLVLKSVALILSVASGLSVGKEGPYVHIATCIGNILTRLPSKYNRNDGKRREVLSASAAAGVAVAFGAPIGGVLFSLEEVSYYFPPKTLFRTFFCCIAAALTTKFLDPYGTRKIVLFEVRYLTDWKGFEMVAFVLLGVLGGLLGALFIKASRFWATNFRRVKAIKQYPLLETFLVAIVTGIVSFWNRYTKLPVAELLFELASPCDTYTHSGTDLCPVRERIPSVIGYLSIAFVIKSVLTVVTFGIKVPAGIYVPSMVVGGLLGRIVGHIVQYLALTYSDTGLFGSCSASDAPEACVVPGVYALVAAGATMCGVTRLSVTLAVILFELTGSLDHVLPFSIAVLVSKWTADAIEPLSIYDLLTDMNAYPFLDNKIRPIFTTELAVLVPPRHRSLRDDRTIDISASPLVSARVLRHKLLTLHLAGELDGGLPILRDGILLGLLPAPDLEFALDSLGAAHDRTLCLMASQDRWTGADADDAALEGEQADAVMQDFTPYIDPAPVALDVHSPMDLVYECFVKLGLRYMCVLRDGRYAGLVHKKAFVKHCKDVEGEHMYIPR